MTLSLSGSSSPRRLFAPATVMHLIGRRSILHRAVLHLVAAWRWSSRPTGFYKSFTSQYAKKQSTPG
jgi:hypothetical protein